MGIYGFQEKASTQIANKFKEYILEPARRVGNEIVPFYQNLSAITGAGKTIILADTISQIRMQLPIEPIVLWISKGKVVVWQTYMNLSSTGKYSEFVGSFKVSHLSECTQLDIEQAKEGLILLATVGKFNQKDMENGDRRIFQPDWDNADDSLWNLLRERKNTEGIQRPLIIIYDEGHNFSNQQTELLLKLQPHAIISASATMRVSEVMNKRVISRIMDDKEWSQQDFITAIKSSDVVKKGLIKQHISLGGYVTPMEVAVGEMIDEFNNLEKIIDDFNLGFKAKAIYVSN